MEYRLDLATLLQMLGQSTGSLSASAVRILQSRGRYTVHLELVRGTVKRSILLDDQGKELPFPTNKVVEAVKDQILTWTFSPAPAPKLEPRLELSPRTLAPQSTSRRLHRIRQVSQQEFSSWPLAYRQVYSLINDPISLQRLQTLLAHSTQDVAKIEQIVTAFLQRGYIAYSDNAPQ